MPERFEIYIVYKRRYINTLPFPFYEHWIPIERLRRTFGVVRRPLDWVISYLAGRTQYVRFDGITFWHYVCVLRRPAGRKSPTYSGERIRQTLIPIQCIVPWTHVIQLPKRHLDRFSRFRVHGSKAFQSFSLRWTIPKIALSLGRSGSPSNT